MTPAGRTTASPGGEKTRRNAELAKIHLLKKRLSLDDQTYRAFLKQITGFESAADLDSEQRGRVLDAMKRFGEPAPVRPGLGPGEPQLRMMRSLWTDLALYGAVRDSSERALARFAKRLTKIDALQWLTASDASTVIEALKAMRDRSRARHTDRGTGGR
ncbi:MAG TPA: regulatory protein GemA [Candidatus Binataceae bacterium]|nr:regulatory protein GemA [Candidatus Binataceae bacterium]